MKNEEEELGGDVAHGGRSDLESSGEGQLSHVERLRRGLIDLAQYAADGPASPMVTDMIALMREAARYLPVWQPIEGAPKDGTWLLLGGPDWVEFGSWQTVYKDEPNEVSGWRDLGEGFKLNDATHWQPMPAPPIDSFSLLKSAIKAGCVEGASQEHAVTLPSEAQK